MNINNKYFLLRHGQTIYQTGKKDFLYPWPEKEPVKLTTEGEKMIESVAKRLKNRKIDLIFSSDIFRVKQSAKIVSKILGIEPKFDKRLRDVNFGVYHGSRTISFYNDFPDSKTRFLKRPNKGENRKDVKKRVKKFIDEIEKRYKNKKILIVSHGDPLLMIEGIIKGLETDEEFIEFTEKIQPAEVGELRTF